ncbi:hypothetical protein NFL50_18895 [Escherichia coli]|nr:hypothetical protein NFL50_18895 [Escherichia coli]WGB98530.1 hypothetical protein NFL54_05625 [Escherichia coli]
MSTSLASIKFEVKDALKEDDFKVWQAEKIKQIAEGTSKDKLEYREYYFNEKMSDEKGYILLDRQLKKYHPYVIMARTTMLKLQIFIKMERLLL